MRCIDNCQLLITYAITKNMPGYVDVTMTATAEWIALGHNRVSLMVGKYLDFAKKEIIVRKVKYHQFNEKVET